jgi:hypothetical protein
MGICMAVLLSAAGLCQETPGYEYRRPSDPKPKARAVEGVAVVRAGAWFSNNFEFQANRMDGLQSTSEQNVLFSTSLMAGIELYDHFMILAMVEADFASKLTAEVGGAFIGWHQRPKERYGKGVPDEVTIYAGVIGGSIKVHEDDFGDFKNDVGFAGGISFGWALSPSWSVEVTGEYRFLEFDYKKEVASGDTSIGGNSGWFGVGLNFRF